MIVALLGIGASIYSTVHHLEVHRLGKTDAACNINDKFSCDEVALSDYSEVFTIPLGVYGLGFFVAQLLLLAIAFKGGKTAREHAQAYAAMAAIGVLVSLALAGISIGKLGAYCVTCMGVYALTLAQAGVVYLGRDLFLRRFSVKEAFAGGASAAIAVAATIAVYNLAWKPLAQTASKNANDGKELPTLADQPQEIPIAKSAYTGLGEDYRRGSDTAKVTIVEFADFQCPACKSLAGTIEQLAYEYGDKILIVYRNYPLHRDCNASVGHSGHPQACKAAILGRCAGQYGKFWEWYQIAFENQAEMSDANLKAWAGKLGLTNDQIQTCWDSADLLAKVKDDVDLGNKLGVNSTPTLFINGRKVLGGRGIAELRGEIDRLLQ
jgi:protein-disulfide isomerase